MPVYPCFKLHTIMSHGLSFLRCKYEGKPALIKQVFASFILVLFSSISCNVFSMTDIIFWHAMADGLGDSVNQIAAEFNQSQNQYRVIPIYKGDYNQTLTSTVAAFRAGQQPDLVQVIEVGTATMVNPTGIIVPVYQLMKNANIEFNYDDILAPIRFYYSDASGNLLAMPFNSSSPVLFYNKTAFKKAGISSPPTTWPEMAEASKKLIKVGYACGFTTGWPSWIQVENFSSWHNVAFASENNGFKNLDARLLINNPVVLKHIQTFADWQKKSWFMYGGRADDAVSLFTSGKCAMIMESSGWAGDLLAFKDFSVGIAALPYWPDVKDAPQNTSIGGAAIWALSGHKPEVYQGIAAFFAFLAKPEIQLQWMKASGYLPITQSAYQLANKENYYKDTPGADVAIKELLNKKPTEFSKGIRLGNYVRIRELIEQALEAAWSGQMPAEKALQQTVEQGNLLLKQFRENVQ